MVLSETSNDMFKVSVSWNFYYWSANVNAHIQMYWTYGANDFLVFGYRSLLWSNSFCSFQGCNFSCGNHSPSATVLFSLVSTKTASIEDILVKVQQTSRWHNYHPNPTEHSFSRDYLRVYSNVIKEHILSFRVYKLNKMDLDFICHAWILF